jgi:hypothetical protein
LSASLCYRFTLGDRAWEIDLMTLSLNDSILLQQLTGHTWTQFLVGVGERDAVDVKAAWWAARRASGENIEIDADEMNPRWADFSVRSIPELTQPDTHAEPPAAKATPKKAPAKK